MFAEVDARILKAGNSSRSDSSLTETASSPSSAAAPGAPTVRVGA
jgi:hypothetical protein